MSDYPCQYEDCNEEFQNSTDRLKHSMEEHHGIDPSDYPNMTDTESTSIF